jgi:hypothetical protein
MANSNDPNQLHSFVFDPRNGDWFLQDLVELVNKSNEPGNIGLTLNLGGLLVSGILVSGKEYFEGVANQFKKSSLSEGSDEKTAKANFEFFSKYTVIYQNPEGSVLEKLSFSPNYIHLRDARFFFPSTLPIPSTSGVWWRGRISQVEGVVFGRIGGKSDSDII